MTRVSGKGTYVPLLDLAQMFGEGWCVTLTRRGPSEAMEVMGVPAPRLVESGLDWVTQRLEEGAGEDREEVALLAHEVGGGWSLVVELEGHTGWVGSQRAVLSQLSSRGGAACSMMLLPDDQEVAYAEDGVLLALCNPATSRLFGEHRERFSAQFATVGFAVGDDDEPGEQARSLPMAERTVMAMELFTGVRLTSEMLAEPWLGGLSLL